MDINKKQLIDTLRYLAENDPVQLKEIIDALGISFSTYYCYRSEILGCSLRAINCDSSFGRSLSHENQKKDD